MEYLKRGITKKEAKLEVADIHQKVKDAARNAKNVQTKTYLNIIADNMILNEKHADQRTR